MLFADRLTIGDRRRTKEGYLAVRARAARAGVYDYLGREVDPDGKHFAADAVVKVYRPETEVFAKDSVHSFMLKPITDDHPTNPVTAANWQDLAKGVNAGAMRDGEYLAFDLVFMDKGLIDTIDAGKRELSNGYASEIVFESGQTEDGQAYDAVQRNIRGNHIAVVDKGRAGPMCRITDEVLCDSATVALLERLLGDERTYSGDESANKNGSPNSGGSPVATKTIIFDGLPLEVTDAAEAAITKLQGQLADEKSGRSTDKTAHDKIVATKDAEIDDLKTKVVDQAKIDQLADAKALVVADAKRIAGDKLGDTAGKSVAEVRRQACAAVLGDAAVADKSDDYIEARFDTLKDGKPPEQRDPIREVLTTGVRTTTNDNGASVRDLARAAQF